MRELKDALRTLLRRPLSSAAAVLAIAVGVGLATAAFSILYGSVLLDRPLADGERLHRVEWLEPHSGVSFPMRWHHFAALRESPPPSVDGVAAWLAGSLLRGLLFDVAPWSLTTVGPADAVLVATSLAAAWLPARRAFRVDPMAVLWQG